MNTSRLVALSVAIASAGGTAALNHVYAGDSTVRLAQADQAQPRPRGEPAGRPPGMRPQERGPRLFTPEERDRFEQKMRAAKSPEERQAVRREMRMAFEQRARERGVPLRPGPEGRPQLSREDHQRFQERWSNAKTPQEREALRREILAAVDERAKARQAQPHGPGPRGPGGPGARGGPGERRDRGPMVQLFTQQERDQFRDRMRNAKDREERMKIRGELHAVAEARAREKGIKLPERGRFEHRRGRSDGGPRSDVAPRSQS